MSRFTVNLNEPSAPISEPEQPKISPSTEPKTKRRKGGCLKILGILGIFGVVILLIGAVGGYFYWQSIKKTPAYSLGLIVDAARRDDKKQIEQLLDTDKVIDSFIPQITDKAVELYGKGLPVGSIAKVSQVAAPLIPAVKTRVKAELPRLIREKTQPVENVPYWLIALFASRAVEIKEEGETAQIKSKIVDRQLELTMKRNGDVWQIVAVKDEALARQIAEKIGQEIIAAATKGGINDVGKKTGINNLGEALKNIDNIFK
jgi:hypothetical protein